MKRSLLFTASALLLAACGTQRVPVHTPPPIVEQAEEVLPQPVAVTPGLTNPLTIEGKDRPGYVNPYPQGSYEYFVAQPAYPKTMDSYCDDALLAQLTAANSKIIVCLPQQRCRVYVNGKVAFDWPVSTGTDGHETPTGVFRVLQKEPDHKSNRYGKFVSNGKTVNGNADLNQGNQPEGAEFVAASMPYWNRLTWDGVGIHSGKVIPGKRLSHGCIRTPNHVAKKFYDHSVMNMPAYITRAVEDYNRGGAVKPIDVKYRPIAGNDYTDMAPAAKPAAPAPAAPAAPAAPQH